MKSLSSTDDESMLLSAVAETERWFQPRLKLKVAFSHG
jgi:hypothetical protein